MMSLNDLAGPTSKTDLAEAADTSKAIYLGNEAILVEHKNKKNYSIRFFKTVLTLINWFPWPFGNLFSRASLPTIISTPSLSAMPMVITLRQST
jgi:hypothetical protein